MASAGGARVTAVIDLTGGPPLIGLLELVKPLGHYAVACAIGSLMVTLDGGTLCLEDPGPFSCTVLGEAVFSILVRRTEAGDI